MRVITVAIVLAALAPLVAHAGVRVSRDGCGPITVQADNARLSEVIAALSDLFPLSHRVMKDSDPRVTFKLTGSVDEVVAALTRHRNVILVRHDNARCPGERVPKTLWVLDGDASASAIVASSSPDGQAVHDGQPRSALFPPEVLAHVAHRPMRNDRPNDPNKREFRSQSEREAERAALRAAREKDPLARPERHRR